MILCETNINDLSTQFKLWRRTLAARIFPPLVGALVRLTWKTCRIEKVLGEQHLQTLLELEKPFIPCYWHQQQIFCLRYLLNVAHTDDRLKLGCVISPSSDGDIASNMFSQKSVRIIRGSATRGGAQALREIYQRIRLDKISPIVTPDGPTGPIFECKPGVAMLAQLSKAPLLPLAYAASNSWQLTSWDSFVLPRPFARIVVGVGEPLFVDKSASTDSFASSCEKMNRLLNTLSADCADQLGPKP